MQKIHLISNAHLDPVWLWRWDEGAAEAISTFRVAAEFCETYDGFVFNHNEAVLYQWVEEYEPQLFKRIQALVKAGKWHIMGGWYLQPDCNMPAGEGIIRQIQQGRQYFKEKFDCVPNVAVNVDSFGHSRGLVQILKKTGYDGYLFCRPLREFLGEVIDEWGYDNFRWKGYDGSEVLGHRHYAIYNSKLGKGAEKLQNYLEVRGSVPKGLMLWGIGDHGGGPSRIDLNEINAMIETISDRQIIHSTPEAFFRELKEEKDALPVIEHDLNPWAPGCYTTQGEIKRKFRELENEMFLTEKMISHAAALDLCPYPKETMKEAEQDMLFSQFHDIIPGTVIPPAMEDSLRRMAHGLELLARVKTKAFFALTKGQEKAKEGEIPIMAYNPHPYPVEGIWECEFHMNEEFSRKHFAAVPVVFQDGVRIPSQMEQETCQMPMQWRRKVAFRAVLEPMQITRFDCRIEKQEKKIPDIFPYDNGVYRFETEELLVEINTRTGLMDRYCVNGKEYLKKGAFTPLVMEDNDHSIGTFVKSFKQVCGEIRLMNDIAATRLCGVYGKLLTPVHIVENGEVRVVLEAVFAWNESKMCLKYYLPKKGTELRVTAIVHWNEKNKMLKLSIPSCFEQPQYMGQVMYGYARMYENGDEAVAQKWTGVLDAGGSRMFSVINDRCYGSSFESGEIRMSLVRSPRYGCLVRDEDRYILYNEGYVPHTDQGVQTFNFWINGETAGERLRKLEREAAEHHETPYLMSFFPSGDGEKIKGLVELKGNTTVITTIKRCDYSEHYLIRLYNAFTEPEDAELKLVGCGENIRLTMNAFEVKTLTVDLKSGAWKETDMLENEYENRMGDD